MSSQRRDPSKAMDEDGKQMFSDRIRTIVEIEKNLISNKILYDKLAPVLQQMKECDGCDLVFVLCVHFLLYCLDKCAKKPLPSPLYRNMREYLNSDVMYLVSPGDDGMALMKLSVVLQLAKQRDRTIAPDDITSDCDSDSDSSDDPSPAKPAPAAHKPAKPAPAAHKPAKPAPAAHKPAKPAPANGTAPATYAQKVAESAPANGTALRAQKAAESAPPNGTALRVQKASIAKREEEEDDDEDYDEDEYEDEEEEDDEKYMYLRLYKTKLCYYFDRYGECHNAERCHFAHGEDELRSAVCRYAVRRSGCRNGAKCAFSHDLTDYRRLRALEN